MYIVDNKTYKNKNGSYIGKIIKPSTVNGNVISRYAPLGSGVYNINDMHDFVRSSKWPVEQSQCLIHYDMADLSCFGRSTFQCFDLGSSSSNGNNINLSYSSSLGGSVLYDGTSDYIYIPASTCAFGTGQFTLEFWFNSTGYFGSRGCLFQTAGSNVNGSMQIWYDNTVGLYMTFRDSLGVTTTRNFNIFVVGFTTQLAITRSVSGDLTCYYNGDGGFGSSSGGTSTVNISNGTGTYIGIQNTGAGQVFRGNIAIFRAYSVELTAAQVTMNYRLNRGRIGI